MSGERWREVSKAAPCPACGKGDWCAWTPEADKVIRANNVKARD